MISVGLAGVLLALDAVIASDATTGVVAGSVAGRGLVGGRGIY
jgi:hypothetical protein